jgi:hypothetical protein
MIKADKIRNDLIDAYKHAGDDFMADLLQRVFVQIKDDRDRILHNEAVTVVSILVGDEPKGFLKSLSNLILREYKPSKRFLGMVANRIMLFAKRKGT